MSKWEEVLGFQMSAMDLVLFNTFIMIWRLGFSPQVVRTFAENIMLGGALEFWIRIQNDLEKNGKVVQDQIE